MPERRVKRWRAVCIAFMVAAGPSVSAATADQDTPTSLQVRADLSKVKCDSQLVRGCSGEQIGARIAKLIVATDATGSRIELICNGACYSRNASVVPSDGIVVGGALEGHFLRLGDSVVVRLATPVGMICRTLTLVSGGAVESSGCTPPAPQAAPTALSAELRGRYIFCGERGSADCPERGFRVLKLLADTTSGALVSVRCGRGCSYAVRKPAARGLARFDLGHGLTLRGGDFLEVLITAPERSWRRIRIGIDAKGGSLRRFDCIVDPLSRLPRGCRLVPQV